MVTVVVVPRDVRRRDARRAHITATSAGYQVRRVAGALAGFVRLEFCTTLQRIEPLVLEAFEIEVDDFLATAITPTRAPPHGTRFTGSRSRVETQ